MSLTPKLWKITNFFYLMERFYLSSQKMHGVIGNSEKVVIHILPVQKQLELFCEKGILKNFVKIHMKTPVPQSLF